MFDLYDVLGITQLMVWGKELIGKKSELYHSEQIEPVKYNYRPTSLETYIGQENAKSLVKLNLQKIKTIKFVHFLISGHAGMGKTSLANVIGRELNCPVTYQIGGNFTMETLIKFLSKSQDDHNNLHILFIDEIHNLEKLLAEFMYPILEDWTLPIDNLKLKPFVLIGATTEKSTLVKKFKPLVDRCNCQIELDDYTALEIKQILIQYNDQLYQKNISSDIYDIISNNCRFCPRIALALFDDMLVCENISQVLKAHRIISNSLTTIDIKILTHLVEIGKPIAQETLAIIGNVDRSDYRLIVEPFLVNQNYISRTSRGRVATEKAKQLLRSLNEKT